jgi:AsmA protein
MSRRWRIVLIACGGIVLVALLALAIAVYLLLQPERFTAMLQAQARGVGLELNLASPARPTLFPRPALDLRGITLNAQDANVPILLAAHGSLALPWRTLFGGPTVISQLQIAAPRVDLDALQAWLAELPDTGNQGLNIPRIDAGVSIRRGSVVRGNELLLRDVAMDAGSLVSGKPFHLSLSALTAAGTPLQLRLDATPRIAAGTLQLDAIALHIAQQGRLVITLAGNAHWRGASDNSLDLRGKLDYADAGQYAVALQLAPARPDKPAQLALKLDGPGNHADLKLAAPAMLDWWRALLSADDPKLAVPPISGRMQVARLDVGSVSVEGLDVVAGNDVPASASSTAPAAASSARPPPATAAPAARP